MEVASPRPVTVGIRRQPGSLVRYRVALKTTVELSGGAARPARVQEPVFAADFERGEIAPGLWPPVVLPAPVLALVVLGAWHAPRPLHTELAGARLHESGPVAFLTFFADLDCNGAVTREATLVAFEPGEGRRRAGSPRG